MPTKKVRKIARRKNTTRKHRNTRRHRKPIKHSRRKRGARPTRRRRKGGDRNAIYGNSAAEEARLAINDPAIKKKLEDEELLDCINKTCKTEATKWADDWAVVKNDQRQLYKYMPTINKSKAEMMKAYAQCDTKLGLKTGTALVAAMRNENSPNMHLPQ